MNIFDTYAIIYQGLSKTGLRVVSSFNPDDPQKAFKRIQEYNRYEIASGKTVRLCCPGINTAQALGSIELDE